MSVTSNNSSHSDDMKNTRSAAKSGNPPLGGENVKK
jgi:hypothetical protein